MTLCFAGAGTMLVGILAGWMLGRRSSGVQVLVRDCQQPSIRFSEPLYEDA